MTMRRILADPLLHFVVLGAILFAFWELSNSRGRGERTVVVSAKRAASLLANFEGQKERNTTGFAEAINPIVAREPKENHPLIL